VVLRADRLFLDAYRALLDLVGEPRRESTTSSTCDPLLSSWRLTTSGGTAPAGGDVEWQILRLCTFGADGLATRYELFGAEQERAALARSTS